MLKKVILAFFLLGVGAVHAFAPQTGTWVVTAELNGQPGRGIALDVQNTTLVMQVYAYQPSGQPTFYMGVGQLDSEVKTSFALNSYTGGRYFGSGPLIGKPAGSAGAVSLRFTSGTSGFVTFPGEPEVAISRFNFAYAALAQDLIGLWSFTSVGPVGKFSEVHALTYRGSASYFGNGIVVSPSGLMACEHQTRGANAGLVLCVRRDDYDQYLYSYYFDLSVNDGEGFERDSIGVRAGQVVYVRRLRTPGDVSTGLVSKNEAQPPANLNALYQLFNQVASRGQTQ